MTAPARPGLRAVVFDMDGVLIDTEPVWRRVEIDVFGSLGLQLTEADCRETMGVRIDEVVALWYRRHPWPGPGPSEVVGAIVDGVIAHVHAEGVPVDGAPDAVRLVRSRGLGCAVASSSPRPLIEAVLDRLGLAADVDVVCSAEDEASGKPAPDVYCTAARLLDVPAAACLAVEDSAFGVLSARAAGMPCVVIPDSETAADPRLVAATLRLASIRQLDAACLEEISARYFS